MTFTEGKTAFLNHRRLKQYSPATLNNNRKQLNRFDGWLRRKHIVDLRQLTTKHLQTYQIDLQREPITQSTQMIHLRIVKKLLTYLVKQGVLLLNPAEDIVTTDRSERLPKPILTHPEIERLLNAPDIHTRYGIRDKALLEVLYATGTRIGEVEQLRLADINLADQTLMIHYAKGGRERVVPLGRTATQWLQRYLNEARPHFVKHKFVKYKANNQTVFVTRTGNPLQQTVIRYWLLRYGKQARINKCVSPHVLRHTCATHLMQQGANIRAIQQLLGHVCLNSTMIYTRVRPLDIKASHQRYHPSETHVAH